MHYKLHDNKNIKFILNSIIPINYIENPKMHSHPPSLDPQQFSILPSSHLSFTTKLKNYGLLLPLTSPTISKTIQK
jgi:hypothetical protein